MHDTISQAEHRGAAIAWSMVLLAESAYHLGSGSPPPSFIIWFFVPWAAVYAGIRIPKTLRSPSLRAVLLDLGLVVVTATPIVAALVLGSPRAGGVVVATGVAVAGGLLARPLAALFRIKQVPR